VGCRDWGIVVWFIVLSLVPVSSRGRLCLACGSPLPRNRPVSSLGMGVLHLWCFRVAPALPSPSATLQPPCSPASLPLPEHFTALDSDLLPEAGLEARQRGRVESGGARLEIPVEPLDARRCPLPWLDDAQFLCPLPVHVADPHAGV